MSDQRLTISFSIWGLFDVWEDSIHYNWDTLMAEYVERGFNCIRLETGHGLLTDLQGNPIEKLEFHPPFGKFSKYLRQMDMITRDGTINFRKRVLELFRAADKYGVKIVPSSWFYIHTYWFLNPDVCDPLLKLTVEEKIDHFAKDLDILLTMLEENDLIHCVAFAELFNEMNYMPSINPPIINIAMCSKKHALSIRSAHEAAIDWLRAKHPTVKFAHDVSNVDFRTDLVPRNIDVLNFHSYYLWKAYHAFEQGYIMDNLDDIPLPESVTKYLNMEITNDDVLDEMSRSSYINTVWSWVPRARIYSDIAQDKLDEAGKLIENEMTANYDQYLARMKRNVDHIIAVRDNIVPHAQLVMGEGVTYCPHVGFNFEETSDVYWKFIEEHTNYMRDKGIIGTVPRTNSGPDDRSWNECKERYRYINRLFLQEEK